MCDIWKGNHNLKQLSEDDISGLLTTLRKFGTRQVLMSGGEALLNPNFFRFCEMLRKENIKVSLLSTGLTLKRNAENLVRWVNDIIVSLDGDEPLHDAIRNIPGAYNKMASGIEAIRSLDPGFQVTGRTVIHRLNFRSWPAIIKAAGEIGLDRISFLPADVSSHAFNRETAWDENRQQEILLPESDLPELKKIAGELLVTHVRDFENHFIAESPGKLMNIYNYYAAFYGLQDFPYKRCNAPWVSTVIESDGSVRPCFFHEAYGNIRNAPLDQIINSEKAVRFRKNLDMEADETCRKCVCFLHLSPAARI
jgi:MoaA/NifB/PqqE/SkfB family radical SAM enzyme